MDEVHVQSTQGTQHLEKEKQIIRKVQTFWLVESTIMSCSLLEARCEFSE